MTTIIPDLSQVPKEAKPKRMLETSRTPDGKFHVKINNSSISIIQDCMMKANFVLNRKLVSNIEPEALTAGRAFHKGLEHWYMLPEHLRQLSQYESEFADTLTGGPMEAPSEPYETALDSINEYVKAASQLVSLDPNDKRGVVNGIKILKNYFKHYENDGLEVYQDEHGPFVERDFEFRLFEDDMIVCDFHGTIDVILRNKKTGEIFVTDHKTTSALGAAFFAKIKPNHQYTGYIMGALALGIKTDKFMVNGIQVAKTKCEFARQITTRNEEDFTALIEVARDSAYRMLMAEQSGIYPMNTTACTGFGNCQFIDVCSAPKALREQIIKNQFTEKV